MSKQRNQQEEDDLCVTCCVSCLPICLCQFCSILFLNVSSTVQPRNQKKLSRTREWLHWPRLLRLFLAVILLQFLAYKMNHTPSKALAESVGTSRSMCKTSRYTQSEKNHERATLTRRVWRIASRVQGERSTTANSTRFKYLIPLTDISG